MEDEIIERMLALVADMPDMKYVRDRAYLDGMLTAQVLRADWRARAAEVTTAASFIELIAARSPATGRACKVLWPDGQEERASDFFESLRLQVMAGGKGE
jgi:hypothetical protein